MSLKTRWPALILLCLLSLSAWAQSDNALYPFDSAANRDRFQTLTNELRCPKCQNQSIADSRAPIASDMRQQVYQRIKAGQSNEAIMNAMVGRFGEFVRYRPRFEKRTIFLWLTPFIVVFVGLGAVALLVMRSRRTRKVIGDNSQDAIITEEEKRQLQDFLAADPVDPDDAGHPADDCDQGRNRQ